MHHIASCYPPQLRTATYLSKFYRGFPKQQVCHPLDRSGLKAGHGQGRRLVTLVSGHSSVSGNASWKKGPFKVSPGVLLLLGVEPGNIAHKIRREKVHGCSNCIIGLPRLAGSSGAFGRYHTLDYKSLQQPSVILHMV